MLTTDFVRDSKRVYRALTKVQGKLIAKESVRIYIPVRYVERGLAFIGTDTYTTGIFMIATEDNHYAVSLVNAMVPIDPTTTTIVTFDNVKYHEFYFRKGSIVINNLNLIKDKKLIYTIFNEIISNGRAPWYLDYFDLAKVLESAQKYAGVNISKNHEVMELLVSTLARDASDRTIYYRQVVNSINDIKTTPPAMIPLRSVQFSATNTTTKLAGSYFRPALVSALVNPSTRVERVEKLLTT